MTGSQPAPAPTPATSARTGPVPLAVIILARNEEDNLPHALAGVVGWAAEVWVVDSLSTDRTAALARDAGAGGLPR